MKAIKKLPISNFFLKQRRKETFNGKKKVIINIAPIENIMDLRMINKIKKILVF